MKVAVSIPDDLFEEAEAVALRTKQPRSRLYAQALRDYLANHSPDRITELANAAADALQDDRPDPFLAEAARRIFRDSEW